MGSRSQRHPPWHRGNHLHLAGLVHIDGHLNETQCVAPGGQHLPPVSVRKFPSFHSSKHIEIAGIDAAVRLHHVLTAALSQHAAGFGLLTGEDQQKIGEIAVIGSAGPSGHLRTSSQTGLSSIGRRLRRSTSNRARLALLPTGPGRECTADNPARSAEKKNRFCECAAGGRSDHRENVEFCAVLFNVAMARMTRLYVPLPLASRRFRS